MKIFDSNLLEMTSIQRLSCFVDAIYGSFNYNEKNDEFDFTNSDSTWAVEQTSYIDKNELEYSKYEYEKKRGKTVNANKVNGAIVDKTGEILAFTGTGMEGVRREILHSIVQKNKKCKRRLLKESTFKRIDLIITIPDNPLFDDEKSIRPLDEYIQKGNFIFHTIFVIFYNSIFVFDGRTGSYKFIPYSFKSS